MLLGVFASISGLQGLDKDKSKFQPGPASSFESKQTNNGVTIAAAAYDSPSLASSAFGKVNPYEHGVLPVLVVIQNDSKVSVKLENLVAEYIGANRDRIEATPARDVQYLKPPKRPNMNGTPLPGLSRKPKNPLAAWEIEGRAFAAKILPPGESAHGFFYFQTGHRSGSKIYLTGLQEAPTGKELLYFEIPLTSH